MDDSEIEALLRRVRPVGPPAELRARILGAAVTRRIWPWIAAAAASVIAAAALQLASGDAIRRTDLSSVMDPNAQVIEAMAEMWGGDATARRMAELIVREQELRSQDITTGGPWAFATGEDRQ